jgi:uncharacterized protein (DUF1330 family)
MPKGYAIFNEHIRDQAGYDGYLAKAVPTLGQFGGRPLIVADGPEVIEPEWQGSRIVVIEFDSVDAARNWYNSPEYQAVVGERHASCDAGAVIVPGLA